MTLQENVRNICGRLSQYGWKNLFLAHGLKISAPNLQDELLRKLPDIDRSIEGFHDFSYEGVRGIEPGIPSRSLLYHALASPNVVNGIDDSNLAAFPTASEIEVIENYVFGISPPSLQDLRQRANGKPLAMAVFTSEYRPAPETVHKMHADMCYSRTGVARIGTKEPLYDSRKRGFVPFVEQDMNGIRVLPARYSVYVATEENGSKNDFGPMRFINGTDEKLKFIIPLHKLFSGKECIRGLNLNLNLKAFHVNEKLRRVHLELRGRGGWSQPDIDEKPFIFSDGLAEFSTNKEHGNGLLVPVVHPTLVEPAEYKHKPLTFTVPKNSDLLSSSLIIQSEERIWRNAPEYVHIRHLMKDGAEKNLNEDKHIIDTILDGNYSARHYIDHTADGLIKPICSELTVEIPRRINAYSLVTAPDFFPNTDQRELMDWWEQSVPIDLKNDIWVIDPLTLSDERKSPNLQLEGANFDKNDKTYTAIVSLPRGEHIRQTRLDVPATSRHSYLPDAASGIFAPGWDISLSRTQTSDRTEHLASYGLGSPFPEDAKLCAALSTFWPAVAPDAARTFEPNATGSPWPTVTPLTDDEIGITGTNPWDGISGPKIIKVGNRNYVEYSRFDYVDYVETALANKFSLSLTGKVDITEYKSRLLAMARVYRALKATTRTKRSMWSVISFTEVSTGNRELKEAEDYSDTKLDHVHYRFQLYRHGNREEDPNDHKKLRVQILEQVTLFVDPIKILFKKSGDSAWQAADV